MNKRWWIGSVSVLAAVAVSAVFMFSEREQPQHVQAVSAPVDDRPWEEPVVVKPVKAVLGYYTVYHPKDVKSKESLAAYGSYLNQMSTQTFTVTETGEVAGDAPSDSLQIAKVQQIGTYATITNQKHNDFNKDLAHLILSDAQVRQRAVDHSLQLVREGGFAGVNVDFENMRPTDRDLYTQFVRELGAALRPHGYRVIVSSAAKTSDSPKSSWIGAFDYRALGEAADQVQLMTYDEHGPWGEPGPTASLPWVKNVLTYATSQIPAEKILLGLPAYGNDWNVTTGKGHKAVAWKNLPTLLKRAGAAPQWDEKSQTPYLRYTAADGTQHVVWYEDARSIAIKTRLVEEFGLAGVAMWRMGLENEEFWLAVEKGLGV